MGDAMSGDYKGQRSAAQLHQVARALQREGATTAGGAADTGEEIAKRMQGQNEMYAPKEAGLNYDIYSQFNPQYAEAGGASDLAALKGSGGQAVLQGTALDEAINPEYYKSRMDASSKLHDLFSGMDPNKLTGAENEGVARGLARSGYNSGEMSTPTAGGAIKSALTYGNALQGKRNAVSNAISSAATILPQFRSGIDVFKQGTGQQGQQAFTGGFAPSQANSVKSGFDYAKQLTDLTGGMEAMRQSLQGNARTFYDAMNQSAVAGSTATKNFSAAGASMCWVAREVFGIDNPMWLLFRHFITFDAPHSWFNRYLKNGQQFAEYIKDKPEIKERVRVWMLKQLSKKGLI